MKCRIEFKPQDCWVGVYWKRGSAWEKGVERFGIPWDVWICLLPMLPLHLSWFGRNRGRKVKK